MKYLIYLFLFLVLSTGCDSTPDTDTDDYNTSEEDDFREYGANEDLAPEALNEVEGADIVTATISGVGNFDLKGTVSIFIDNDKNTKINVTLDGIDRDNYEVYITGLSSCNELDQLSANMTASEQAAAEVDVLEDGTGREERVLYSAKPLQDYRNRVAVVYNELGEIVGCGVLNRDDS